MFITSVSLLFVILSTMGGVTLPGRQRFECSGWGGEHLYPDEDNCQCYWDCANHIPYHRCCGPGTMYDPVNMDCDFTDFVDCGDRPLPGSTRPPITTTSTTVISTTSTQISSTSTSVTATTATATSTSQ